MKQKLPSSPKAKLGQYFTPQPVADFMLRLANVSTDAQVLEPSCGAGVFLERLHQRGFHQITAFEVDSHLAKEFDYVQYASFVSADITQKFDLIIGNPPYIGWKKLPNVLKEELSQNLLWQTYCNSLCDYLFIFILKSVELLKPGGELIFICPEYWLNTTHSQPLRNYLMENGYFECFYHFSETPIFEQANISTIIFKYVKTKVIDPPSVVVIRYTARQELTSQALEALANTETKTLDLERFKVPQFKHDEKWLLVKPTILQGVKRFEESCQTTIGEVCDIAHGLVSGLEKAFRLPEDLPLNDLEKKHLLSVVKGKNLMPFRFNEASSYIFLNEVETEAELKKGFPHFYKHLQPFKAALKKRYQYNRTIPYWHWVFLRSFQQFSQPQPRIFVPVKERITHKNYVRFAGIPAGLYPTQDVIALFPRTNVRESLWYILAFLNSPEVFEWYKYHGIVKGGVVEFSERPLASIPFRTIDWENPAEVALHEQITKASYALTQQTNTQIQEEVNQAFAQLLGNL
ncbi:restriction endonuclease [marine bacterium AO1-C]|nr:restriction endonuclease [marine bacterium AO1-C]